MPRLRVILLIVGTSWVVVGLGLVLIPERMRSAHEGLRKWLQDRNLLGLLNRPRRIEPSLYRHHHVSGGLIIVGALALLVFLDRFHGHLPMGGEWSTVPGFALLMSFAWGLSTWALIVGAYLFIRPSALKGVETLANRWIEPCKGILNLMLRRPRLSGVMLLVAGLSCLGTAIVTAVV